MTIYEPGTVAVATAYGAEGVRVFRVEGSHPWRSANTAYTDNEVTDIRPLVVLDLDGIAPEAIAKALRDKDAGTNGTGWARVAEQIEAQAKPPRIPEPGLWGVVTDNGDDVWVCTEPGRWTRIADGVEWPWVDITDPVLIRDGV